VLLDVPLALPLALLTFAAGFFPIVGALVAGFAAAMVALAANGVTTALLVVGATLLVQQVEGNLLQPLIVGRAVRLHPAVIIVAVATGGVLWGVAGAFIAVPTAAVVSQAVGYLRTRPVVTAPP
jgi:predicted PurR-regulated permease PerM